MGWFLGVGLLLVGAMLIGGGFLITRTKPETGVRPEKKKEEDVLVEQLKTGLNNRDYKVRVKSVEQLGNVSIKGLSGVLFQAMADKNEEVRLAAAAALKKTNDPSIAGALVSALKEPHKWLPARVADVLIFLGEPAVPVLHDALSDNDPIYCGYIIEILGEIGAEKSTQHFYHMLKNESVNIRLQAAKALGKTAPVGSANIVAELLEDPEDKVKIQAIRSLGFIGGTEAVGHLYRVLGQADPVLHFVALEALSRMGLQGCNMIREIAELKEHPANEAAQRFLSEGEMEKHVALVSNTSASAANKS
jgi:HEAT repeat protein